MSQIKAIPMKRLVMITGGQCCMCDNPDPLCNPHTWHINIQADYTNNLGYITCNKEECHIKIKNYIKKLYDELYRKPIWQDILKKFANNEYVSVPRNIGIVEHNWNILSKKFILSKSDLPFNMDFGINYKFILSMLCNFNSNTAIPSYIWYQIYNMCLYLYQPYIKVCIEYDGLFEKMNYLIGCEKSNHTLDKKYKKNNDDNNNNDNDDNNNDDNKLYKFISINIFEELNF